MVVHIVLGSPSEGLWTTLTKNQDDIYVGVDRGALLLLQADYPLDIAVGDFDSISDEDQSLIDYKATECILKEDQDHTDFELALKIVAKKYPGQKIYLHNWKGGRLDHMMSILFVAYQSHFQKNLENLVMLHPNNTVSFYRPGNHIIEKDMEKNYLSFVTLEAVKKLSLCQVKYPVKDLDLKKPRALISNEFLSREAQLSFKEGLIMVIQSKDE